MAILLHNIRRGVSPEPKVCEQMMQIRKRRERDLRRAKPKPSTNGRIEHPGRHDGHNAQRHLDVENLAVGPPLTVLPPQSTPVQRMPAIVNDYVRLDMGRMSP
jgi:hypothetical protein